MSTLVHEIYMSWSLGFALGPDLDLVATGAHTHPVEVDRRRSFIIEYDIQKILLMISDPHKQGSLVILFIDSLQSSSMVYVRWVQVSISDSRYFPVLAELIYYA
jgi:hypothetical protein